MRFAILGLLGLALSSAVPAQTPQPQSRSIPSAFIWQESADVRSGLPVYPPAAVAEKRDATVEVELVIGTDGQILHARMSESGGDLFDAATMSAVRGWRFSPFRDRSGRPMTILVLARVDYRLESKGPIVSAKLGPVSDNPPALSADPNDVQNLGEIDPAGGPGRTWPKVIREIKPSYSAEAMRTKVQGETTVEVTVRADGTVGHVRVLKSLEPSLDRQAQIAAAYWLFTPATRNGKPVAVRASVIMSFNLH
jgi:TonB family protein